MKENFKKGEELSWVKKLSKAGRQETNAIEI